MLQALLAGLPDMAVPYLYGGLLVLARIASLTALLPGMGRTNMPGVVRATVVIALTVVVDLGLGGVALPLPESPPTLLLAVARELLMGSAMGLAIRLVFAVLESAGALMSISMGLSLNVFVDPSTGEQTMSLSTLMSLLGAMIFLALGGHYLVLQVLFRHMELHPVGGSGFYLPSAETLAQAGVHFFATALMLASPVVVVTLLINIALAFVTRVVPSLNLFAVVLGLMMLGGFLALGMAGDAVVEVVGREMQLLPERMVEMAGTPL